MRGALPSRGIRASSPERSFGLRPQDDTGRGPSVHGPSHPVPKSCHAEQCVASGQPRYRGSCHAERSEASGQPGHRGRPCHAMHVVRTRVASATFARPILRPAASGWHRKGAVSPWPEPSCAQVPSRRATRSIRPAAPPGVLAMPSAAKPPASPATGAGHAARCTSPAPAWHPQPSPARSFVLRPQRQPGSNAAGIKQVVTLSAAKGLWSRDAGRSEGTRHAAGPGTLQAPARCRPRQTEGPGTPQVPAPLSLRILPRQASSTGVGKAASAAVAQSALVRTAPVSRIGVVRQIPAGLRVTTRSGCRRRAQALPRGRSRRRKTQSPARVMRPTSSEPVISPPR